MTVRIGRRNFIAALGGAAAWPLCAHAQQAGLRQVAIEMLYGEGNSEGQILFSAFRDALAKLGWTDGRNVRLSPRWPGTDRQRVQEAARDIVASHPDVIVSSASPTTMALLRETHTIPIVFVQVVDPVAQGFVASLPQPGGNATGLANFEASMAGKWIELLKTVSPPMTKLAVPFNPGSAPYAEIYLKSFRSLAPSFGVEVVAPQIADLAALDSFCASQTQSAATAVVPMPSGFVSGQLNEIAAIMSKHRLPSLYVIRAYAEAGGLLSYGNDINDNFRRAATFVDRILKGEKASELPVQFPVKLELAVNTKTAKLLDIHIPPQLLATADEVIE